jgi:hypothetical protein
MHENQLKNFDFRPLFWHTFKIILIFYVFKVEVKILNMDFLGIKMYLMIYK